MAKSVKLIIKGRLPSLNEYSDSERAHHKKGARLKRETENLIIWFIRSQLRSVKFAKPVHISYLWVEKDRNRDKDNIAFAKKFVQDALVKAGVLHNDGWAWVEGFDDNFMVDKQNPRVEITIWEVE